MTSTKLIMETNMHQIKKNNLDGFNVEVLSDGSLTVTVK